MCVAASVMSHDVIYIPSLQNTLFFGKHFSGLPRVKGNVFAPSLLLSGCAMVCRGVYHSSL